MPLVIGIVVVFALAAVMLFVTVSRSRTSEGRLSRETRSRDAGGASSSSSTDLEAVASAEGRARSAESQATAASGVPAMPATGTVAVWEPVDEEELGVSRRQFLNRANVSLLGLGMLPLFGASLLAFLWPTGEGGGFGAKYNIGKLSDILTEIQAKKKPFYASEARTYVQLYPTDADAQTKAESAYEGNGPLMGLDQGFVALWQRCVHLGCRVPWCQSSQWFECPCHGSKYNKVGEKKDGPAPRGLDRFAVEVADGNLIVNTGVIFQGPPFGTDTTGQKPEGPACV